MGNGGSSTAKLHNTLFQLKFTAKRMTKLHAKGLKKEKEQKKKLKKAIEQGNREGAKIYAANAIREKNQALNYLRLASRIDAVAARVETAVNMSSLTKDMMRVTTGMDSVLTTMNPERITKVMDKFERQFEDLDVATAYQAGAMDTQSALSTPAEDVDNLIQQEAELHGLSLGEKMGFAPTKTPESAPAEKNTEGDLMARLAALQK